MSLSRQKKIKVLILINDLLLGGAQRIILDTCRLIDREKFLVHVVYIKNHVIFPQKSNFLKELEETGTRITCLGGELKFSWKEARGLRKILLEEKPDVIHTYLPYAGVFGRIICRLMGFKNIVSTQCNLPSIYKSKVYWIDKITLPLAKTWTGATLAIEEAYGKSIAIFSEDLWKRGRRHFSIPAGVDVSHVQKIIKETDRARKRGELGLEENDIAIITIARLIKWKGNSELFRAVVLLPDNVHLLIIGWGPYHEQLKKETEEFGISKRVHFLMERKDIYELFAGADIYVQNHVNFPDGRIWRGPNTSQMEAVASGLPSISIKVPLIESLIEDGITGKLVDPNNPEKMAETIRWMINHKEEAHRMAERALKKVDENYSLKIMVSRYQNLYKYAAGAEEN